MIGQINSEETFVASNLSVRCPSKYMTEERLYLNRIAI